MTEIYATDRKMPIAEIVVSAAFATLLWALPTLIAL